MTNRRDFITLLGGAAAWPIVARAQSETVRRVGILMGGAADDPDEQARVQAFREGLEKVGWSERRNIHIDLRYASASAEQAQVFAKELIAQQTDVILATSTGTVAALQQETSTIPVVFTQVSDPVGSGFVTTLARPGGNLTGFLLFEGSIAGKWLLMLKEFVPGLSRVAFMANPKTTAFDYFLRAAETIAPSLAI
jgi:putative ABC transport system substrate-binding protein